MRRSIMARDAGLRRIADVTLWLTAGVVALSGGLALLAADSFRGHSSSASSSNAAAQLSQPQNVDNGLGPINQAPAQSPAAPVVTSGGS
jgi:hypothetical protein